MYGFHMNTDANMHSGGNIYAVWLHVKVFLSQVSPNLFHLPLYRELSL